MESLKDFLQLVPIFSDLPDNVIEQIIQVGNKKTYAKDSVILVEEEAGTALFTIMTGKVKVSRSSADGREVILSILGDS